MLTGTLVRCFTRCLGYCADVLPLLAALTFPISGVLSGTDQSSWDLQEDSALGHPWALPCRHNAMGQLLQNLAKSWIHQDGFHCLQIFTSAAVKAEIHSHLHVQMQNQQLSMGDLFAGLPSICHLPLDQRRVHSQLPFPLHQS